MDLSGSDLVRNHKYVNDCGFGELDLIKRKNDMKQLAELYPHLCPSMIEMAWNFCNMHTEDELQDIIASKKFEQPSNKQTGGISQGCYVEKGETLGENNTPTI